MSFGKKAGMAIMAHKKRKFMNPLIARVLARVLGAVLMGFDGI